jgi:hypothetical protein
MSTFKRLPTDLSIDENEIHAGTRVGGYSLEQTKADDRTRPIAKYKLSKHEKST